MGLVIFDLDDTLVDRRAAVRRWIESILRLDRGGETDPAVTSSLLDSENDGKASRDEFLAAVDAVTGPNLDLSELRQIYASTYLDCYLYEERSVAALTLLRQAGWSIGVATNGSPLRTRAKMKRAGIDELVDGVCIAQEIGTHKPDRRVLQAVAKECGVDLAGWMVGDAPIEDIHGGATEGLDTIWLRRNRAWTLQEPRPTYEVDDVLEAADIIMA